MNITEEEKQIIGILGEAYKKFIRLPILHTADQREFMHAIHIAQNIVLARSALRQEGFIILEDDENKSSEDKMK